MSARKFFFISLVLVVLALGFHLTALGQFSSGLQHRARAATVADPNRLYMRAEAHRYYSRGRVAAYLGLASALGSAISFFVSFRRREPAWHSVTFALLIFYVMLHFALV